MRRRGKLLLALAVVALLSAAGLVVAFADHRGSAAFRGSTVLVRIELPRFALHDWNGEPVTSEQMSGKVLLVTFLDSQCKESCPLIASQIAQALDRLSARERAQVVAIAFTTDPAEDTPEAIRGFLERHRALGKLHYLVGSLPELRPVWKAFKILPSLDSGNDDLHSAPVRIYGRDGVWIATQHPGVDLTPDNLLHDLRLLLSNP